MRTNSATVPLPMHVGISAERTVCDSTDSIDSSRHSSSVSPPNTVRQRSIASGANADGTLWQKLWTLGAGIFSNGGPDKGGLQPVYGAGKIELFHMHGL